MHELSLCHSIADIVERARQGRAVSTVHLRVGQLRQVVPDTLAYCWTIVTDTTPLAGSVLEIDHVPVALDCHSCGARSTVTHELILACPDCASAQVVLVAGEELSVTALDVADDVTDDVTG